VTVAAKAEEENRIRKLTRDASLQVDRMNAPYPTIAGKISTCLN
jgi:hypothetical protein